MTKARTLADLLDSSGDVKSSALDNQSSDIASVEDDTSPSLGGDLDLNSSDITGTGNIDITGSADFSSSATIGTDVILGSTSQGLIFGNTNGVNIRSGSGKDTIFDNAGTERMRLTSDGSLGVGTGTIEAPLHVLAENSNGINAIFGAKDFIDTASYNYDDANIALQGRDASNNDTGAGIQYTVRNSGNTNWLHGFSVMDQDGSFRIGTGGAGTTAAAERFRIESDGDVLIKGNSGSISHAFNYNENGGEVVLYDEGGSPATLIDQASNNTRLLELINGSNIVLGLGSSNTTGAVILNRAGYVEGYRLKNNGVHEWKPSTYNGWTVFETAGAWTFQKQFNANASNTTWNLFRMKRFYWGHGHYKINVQENYYYETRDSDFYIDGHTRDGASYNPDVHVDAEHHQGDMGFVITRTSPSNSAPGSADQAYTDIQLTLAGYRRAVVTMTIHKNAVSWFDSTTSMPSTNCFALF